MTKEKRLTLEERFDLLLELLLRNGISIPAELE